MKKDESFDNIVRRPRCKRSETDREIDKVLKKAEKRIVKARDHQSMSARSESLIGKCLVHIGSAQNELYDQSVIYITECTADVVRGIMINKLLFGTAAIECKPKENTQDAILRNVYEDLYQGGPENPAHGYVLFPKEDVLADDPFAEIQGDIAVSTSFGVLQEILDGAGPTKKIIAMGHCEWHRGELEWEIFNNQWLIVPSSIEIMFDTELTERWLKAKKMSGVNEMLEISHVGLA